MPCSWLHYSKIQSNQLHTVIPIRFLKTIVERTIWLNNLIVDIQMNVTICTPLTHQCHHALVVLRKQFSVWPRRWDGQSIGMEPRIYFHLSVKGYQLTSGPWFTVATQLWYLLGAQSNGFRMSCLLWSHLFSALLFPVCPTRSLTSFTPCTLLWDHILTSRKYLFKYIIQIYAILNKYMKIQYL